jgi:RHS repeat-associated protein
LTASYRYDYLGRRRGIGVNGSDVYFVYNGQNLIAEKGTSVADYVFGPGIDEPLAMSRAGSIYYYNTDGLGSIPIVNDTYGAVSGSYVYDAWGVIRAQTGSTPNPFGYTAREFAEAGLMYYRARYYNPNIGRFVSEDPIDFDSGQVNFYAYANNMPSNMTDPFGLKVVNKTKCTIYVKEEGSSKTHPVAPGGTYTKPHDGFANPCDNKCQVFKNCNNIDVTVNPGGNVTTSGGSFMEKLCQASPRGGWKDLEWCEDRHADKDFGWDELFDRSGADGKACKCPCTKSPGGL